MKILGKVAFTLLIIGGLNWGLVGIFEFDLVEAVASSLPIVQRIIYILVGLSTVYVLFDKKNCCSGKSEPSEDVPQEPVNDSPMGSM